MLLFLLASGPWAAGQMFSSTTRMSNCTGSQSIVRQNQIGQTVICLPVHTQRPSAGDISD